MANEDGLYTNLGGGQWAKNVSLTGRNLEIRDEGTLTRVSVPAGGKLESSVMDFSGVEVIAVGTYMDAAHAHRIDIEYADKNGNFFGLDNLFNASGGNSFFRKTDFAWYKGKVTYTNSSVGTQGFTFFAYGRK